MLKPKIYLTGESYNMLKNSFFALIIGLPVQLLFIFLENTNQVWKTSPILFTINKSVSYTYFITIILFLINLLFNYIRLKREAIPIKFFIKSLLATYSIRRFCYSHLTKNKEKNTANSNEQERKEANKALKTLAVNYTKQAAICFLKVPINNDSRQILINKFPEIRDELTSYDSNYIFGNITRVNKRTYKTIANKK